MNDAQVKFLQIYSNGDSFLAVMRALGIPMLVFDDWQRETEFADQLSKIEDLRRRQINNLLLDCVRAAILALLKTTKRGGPQSIAAARLILQVAGFDVGRGKKLVKSEAKVESTGEESEDETVDDEEREELELIAKAIL